MRVLYYAIDKNSRRTLVYPNDPAIDPGHSDLLAYLQDPCDETEREHLTYRAGQEPARYTIRPLDSIELDDQIANAEAHLGDRPTRRLARRTHLLVAMAGIEQIERDGETYTRPPEGAQRAEKRAWQAAVASIPHDVKQWLGSKIQEASKCMRSDHLLDRLIRLSSVGVALERLIQAIEEDGSVTPESDVFKAARASLQLATAGETVDLGDPGKF